MPGIEEVAHDLMFLPCDAYHCWGQAVAAYASHMKFGSRRGHVVLPTLERASIRYVQGTVHVSPGLLLFSPYVLTVKLKLTRKLLKSCPKFLDIGTNTYGAEDVSAMQNREDLIQALYNIDGRDKPSHPQHGLLTGLWQKYFKG